MVIIGSSSRKSVCTFFHIWRPVKQSNPPLLPECPCTLRLMRHIRVYVSVLFIFTSNKLDEPTNTRPKNTSMSPSTVFLVEWNFTYTVMILPSCPWFSLVVRQNHDRIMFCVQAHGLFGPCACVVSLRYPAPLLSSFCHYCLVSFTCPCHSCSPL